MKTRKAAQGVGNRSREEGHTYLSVVQQWALERELLRYVQPYTAKRSAQKALLFVPWIGAMDVASITPRHITSALIELGISGGRSGKGLSPTTLRAAHLAGGQAFDWAISQGFTRENPFKHVPRPKVARKPAHFLTSLQAASFATQITNSLHSNMEKGDIRSTSFTLAVCIALATGLRRGEIFALDWDDVDVDRQRIGVGKAIKGDGTLGQPKTRSGIRSVAIGSGTQTLLDEVRHWQEQKLPQRLWPCNCCVICDRNGERASLNAFEHWWHDWIQSHGWEGLRFHDLRHTHATLLIAGGTDVKTVQMRLGHSSAEITMSCYAHAIPLSDSRAAMELDASLFA